MATSFGNNNNNNNINNNNYNNNNYNNNDIDNGIYMTIMSLKTAPMTRMSTKQRKKCMPTNNQP